MGEATGGTMSDDDGVERGGGSGAQKHRRGD